MSHVESPVAAAAAAVPPPSAPAVDYTQRAPDAPPSGFRARTGLTDPRVTYWEPAKWVARLRVTKTDDNVLLLKTNMGAGHAGRSGRYESLREDAEEAAFILWQLGIAE